MDHLNFKKLNFGASAVIIWVQTNTVSAACPTQSSSLAITSITFARVICDADESCLFCEYCEAPESS